MSLKVRKSSSNFSVNPTLPLLDGPLMLPPPNYVDLSISPSLSLSFSLSLTKSSNLIALNANPSTFIQYMNILKLVRS